MAAKKGKRALKSQFSVAMSQDTGCVVMVRTYGDKATVIGSLTREQSLAFADSIIDWEAPADKTEQAAKSIAEAVNGELKPRPVYPH